MSEGSGYSVDSDLRYQTLSEPLSSTMSRSGMSSETYFPQRRVSRTPGQPFRGNQYATYMNCSVLN